MRKSALTSHILMPFCLFLLTPLWQPLAVNRDKLFRPKAYLAIPSAIFESLFLFLKTSRFWRGCLSHTIGTKLKWIEIELAAFTEVGFQVGDCKVDVFLVLIGGLTTSGFEWGWPPTSGLQGGLQPTATTFLSHYYLLRPPTNLQRCPQFYRCTCTCA